jgi:hypothetical protein
LRTPPETDVAPEYPSVPESVSVPLPDFVRPSPLPLMSPPRVILPPPAVVVIVGVALKVIWSLMVSMLVPPFVMLPLRVNPLAPAVPQLITKAEPPALNVMPATL